MENIIALKMLAVIATKLGTTVEYLWAVLVKQAVVASVTNIIQYGILAFITYQVVKFYKDKDVEDSPALYIGFITAVVLLGILWLAAFFSLPQTINGFINPEYEAIKTVLDAVKPASN
jgi:hypothetical protein